MEQNVKITQNVKVLSTMRGAAGLCREFKFNKIERLSCRPGGVEQGLSRNPAVLCICLPLWGTQ